MRRQDTDKPAQNLRDQIAYREAHADLASQEKDQSDRRIEMRSRYRTKDQDENHEEGARGQSIAEERYRIVAIGKRGPHDPGPDDACQQQRSA